MAEATVLRNAALPYPVYAAPYAVTFPLLDADGDPVSPSSPDSERSLNGDTFADCTNEATEIATSTGICYLALTAAEMTADIVTLRIQSTGAKTTVLTLFPRKLVTIRAATANDDGSGTSSIVLDSSASAIDDYYNGMVCVAILDTTTTEMRIITDYNGSTKAATVVPDWTIAPDNTDTFTIYLADGTHQHPSVYAEKVYSDTTIIYSDTTTIQSDVTTLASDLAEGDFSDILSRLTVTNSNVLIIKSDVSDVLSRAVVINSETTDIQSETEVIQSQAVAIRAIVSDIQSDTNVMVPIVSDIQSDTNVLVTKMRGVVLATGTIGATGNSTTVLHIPDAVLDSLSDDEINNYNVVVYDVSLDEYHARTIVDWTNTGDLATVAPALPFTPEASVDLYWIMPPWANQFDGDISDILSRLTVTNSLATKVYSDTTTIQSDTTTLASDLAEGDFSDILSRLTVTNSDAARIESKVVQIYSDTTKIDTQTLDIQSETEVIQSLAVAIEAFASDTYSDTTAIHTQTTAIASDTTTLASDLAEADFSDIHSRLTLVLSDTSDIRSHLTALTGAAGVISDIASGVDAIQAAGGALTAAQDSKLTQINSDVISQFVVIEQNTSDTESALVKVYSDTTAIEGAGGALTAAQDSKLTKVNSGTIVIKSDVAQITFTVAGKVDANIEYVNGTEVTGAGTEGDPWGP
jgi:hypothetical protein